MMLQHYLQSMRDRGLSHYTIYHRKNLLKRFLSTFPTPEIWSVRTILDWLHTHEITRTSEKMYREWINQFFAWWGEQHNQDPIRLPSLKVKENFVDPSDLLSKADILQMIQSCDHPRDRALIAVLYESGCRAREVLGIQEKHITVTPQFVKIKVSGKTGTRIIPLVESAPYLQQWLEYAGEIPTGESIWQAQQGGSISYSYLYQIIQRAGETALGREDVHPHLLRHSCATAFARSPHFNTALLCERFGWKQGSTIVQRYVHLAGKDLEKATLAMYDKQPIEKPDETSPLAPQECPRCHYDNPADAKFCGRCSFALSAETAQEYVEAEAVAQHVLELLLQNKDLLRELKKRET